jgi:hypothetical protein
MVKVIVENQIFHCGDYKWEDNGIVLYNVLYDGSLWKEIEIFNTTAFITVFKDETKLTEEPW